jgi:putative phosphoesterase
MALYGVLGDIHGNREALAAVLARLEDVDRIVCVGDLVGYNADPDECVHMLREREAICIAGNHDLIGTGRLGFERCSNKAMHSLKQTRRSLAPETARYLQALPAHHVLEGRFLLTHGGVRDVQQYMTRPEHFNENAGYLRADFPGIDHCFYGHTHEQRIHDVDGARFVNPGSVDASRKRGAKLAEYATFDSGSLAIEFGSVPYEDDETERKAEAAGYRIDRWRDRLYDVQRRIVGPRQV